MEEPAGVARGRSLLEPQQQPLASQPASSLAVAVGLGLSGLALALSHTPSFSHAHWRAGSPAPSDLRPATSISLGETFGKLRQAVAAGQLPMLPLLPLAPPARIRGAHSRRPRRKGCEQELGEEKARHQCLKFSALGWNCSPSLWGSKSALNFKFNLFGQSD